MSGQRNNILCIREKKGKEPIVCISAYTFPMANLIDEFCDLILVGDSLGMTVYGMKNTLGVSLDMMINHGQAVVNGSKKSLVVVDMPYGSYEKSKEQALKNAVKVMSETGCNAVKLEMSLELVETVEFLVANKIPVVAHVGLTPQHIEKFGGFKIQGRNEKVAKDIVNLAILCEKAGAFALVIEGVVEKVGREITEKLDIPTIGIGASPECDGQVLVIDDILGIKQEYSPKFVKQYADLSAEIKKAVEQFSLEVKSKKFPSKEHCFY